MFSQAALAQPSEGSGTTKKWDTNGNDGETETLYWEMWNKYTFPP